MKAIDILKQEHRVIEGVLDALDAALGKAEAMGPTFFLETTDFMRGFADEFHHMKEENVLFELLIAHGMPRHGGPVAVMLAEHEQGRQLTRALRSAAERWAGGDVAARAEVVDNAQNFIDLLRQHIVKEDNILFMVAEQLLPPDAQTQALAEFERVEQRLAAPGTREKYIALAAQLRQTSSG
jgi:hemerythrin-like domain-containing protein